MFQINKMWTSLLLLLPLLIPARGYTLEYLIDEELPPYTSVADLFADFLTQTMLRFDTSQLKFRIIKKDQHEPVHFIIHEEAGLLYTAISFNREQLCPDQLACQLTIDVGIMSRFWTQEYERFQVNVYIKDINDNSPKFPRGSLDIMISESSPEGSMFSLLQATDQDAGENGNLKYKLDPCDGPFRLQKDYLPRIYLTIKKKLVHDLKNVFVLSLYAEDGGSPTRNSSLLLNILVTAVDIIITSATSRAQSTQNISSPSTQTTLPAVSDKSAPTFTHNPTSTSPKIPQSTDTTHVPLTTTESRPSPSQSSLPTTAKTEMTSTTTQSPITQEKSTSTERMSPTVTDHSSKTSTGSISETPMTSSSNSTSSTESLSTTSSTTSRLDVPTLSSSNGANVTFGPEGAIYEIDFEFHVTENLPSGTHVGVVKLTYHTDTFPPSNYTLYTAQDKPDSFSIDPSGLLTTSRFLDREKFSEYYLIVYDANRNFITSNASVIVKVVVDDVNDHKPIFTFPTILNSTILVQFNSTPNQFVAKLNSIDQDTGMNGKVSFRIDYGNENGLFKIDNDTGVMAIARYMEFGDNLNYQLVLSAADHGDIPLMTWSMLKVNFTQVAVGQAMAENGMMITSIIIPVTIVITIIIVVIIGRESCFRGNCCSRVPEKDYDSKEFGDFTLHAHDAGMPKIRSDSMDGTNTEIVW